jgi:hypothetical protein
MTRKLLLLFLLAIDETSESVIRVLESGRIIGCTESPSDRLAPTLGIAPGAPPAFSFRTFDAGDRGRLSDVGLMTDDAGH